MQLTLTNAKRAATNLINDAIRNQVAHPAYSKFKIEARQFSKTQVAIVVTVALKNTHVFNGGRKFNDQEMHARTQLAKVALFRVAENSYAGLAMTGISWSDHRDNEFQVQANVVSL